MGLTTSKEPTKSPIIDNKTRASDISVSKIEQEYKEPERTELDNKTQLYNLLKQCTQKNSRINVIINIITQISNIIHVNFDLIKELHDDKMLIPEYYLILFESCLTKENANRTMISSQKIHDFYSLIP